MKTAHRPASRPSDRTDASWHVGPGEELAGGFVVDRLLGGGHDYEAYLAFDPRRYCLIVLKMLRPHLVHEARHRAAIAREAAALEQIDHPVTVRLFDADATGSQPYVAMEYVEGPRLSTLMRRNGRLPIEQVLPLGLQLTSALHYLSTLGLVHLDIKPKNIIMAGPPRLIDFSIATAVERTGDFRGPIGTRTYMAPEQVTPQSAAGIGPAADVWGLGTVLYEAVAGRPAFPLDGPHEHPQLHEAPPPLGRAVPALLATTIEQCLSPQASQRPTPVEVSEALGELVARLPRRMVLSRLRPGARV